MAHRGVEAPSEHEADAELLDRRGNGLGIQFDRETPGLEQVGGATGSTRRAVAVLGNPDTSGGGDHRPERRHVERGGAVTACSARVQQGTLHLHALGIRDHRLHAPRDLVGRDTLGLHRNEPGRNGSGVRIARHDLSHDLGGALA